jgi:2-dehydro-3-deoxyphosphogluconate aldolase/(4S)-4-hydroxy-2-oxoglutarate aldolase
VTAQHEQLTEAIAAQRVIPVLRTETVDDAVETALVCAENGMIAVELTTSTPDVAEAARRLGGSGVTVGVGTIRDAGEIAPLVDAGARFVVSYFRPEGFVAAALAAGALPIPGALTPTEIQTAASEGARIIKIFPGWQSDPRVIGDLAPLVRGVRYIVTAGLTPESTTRWFAAGALAVGTGRALGTVATIGADAVAVNVRRVLAEAGAGA